MAILGFDLSPLRQGVQDAFAALRQAGEGLAQAGQPGLNTGLVQAAQQPAGLNTGLLQAAQQQGAASDPWATLGQVAQQVGLNTDLLGFGAQQVGTDFSAPFALRNAIAAQNAQRVTQATQATTQSTGHAVTETTASGGGAATSDDNRSLTPQQIDQWISQTRPNSPLAGKGAYILQVANQYGVSVPLMLGIFLKESELGTTAGPGMNLAGLTDPATDGGLGGVRTFQGNATWEDAIAKTAANLASSMYKGKSLQEQVGTWYVGPQAWAQGGLGATDRAGNGTVQDYVNLVGQVYQGLGVPLGGAPQAGAGQAGGLASITPGVGGQVMQEFGPTEYAAEHASTYTYANQFGLDGAQHPGVDWAVPIGTRVATPLGGTVSVVGSDHGTGYYYTNTMTGSDPDHSGEFAVTLDNGDILILGHLSRIDAAVGQRVDPGQLIGLSGGSDGAHIHVEYRQRQPDGSYRIIDPRTVLGGTGGDNTGNR